MSASPVGGGRSIHVGLLVLRIGIGIMFMVHGVPKLLGGPGGWEKVGQMGMSPFGITFAYPFWGFMAALAEAVGGLFLALGLLVRPWAALMAFTMLAATLMKMNGAGAGAGLFGMVKAAAHPLELGIVFVAFIIMGGGVLSLGAKIKALRGKWYQ